MQVDSFTAIELLVKLYNKYVTTMEWLRIQPIGPFIEPSIPDEILGTLTTWCDVPRCLSNVYTFPPYNLYSINIC